MEQNLSLSPAQIQYLKIGPKVGTSNITTKQLQDSLTKFINIYLGSISMEMMLPPAYQASQNSHTATSNNLSIISECSYTEISWEPPPSTRPRNSAKLQKTSIPLCRRKKINLLTATPAKDVPSSTPAPVSKPFTNTEATDSSSPSPPSC